jgi:type IV pilus assembly protein PilM
MFTKGTDTIALHFADSSILALRLEGRDQKYNIVAVSSIALKPGVIEDGRILSLPDLATAVTQLFSQAKPQAMKPKEVVICLPESKVFSVALLLPATVSGAEAVDSLRRKVAEVIPVEDGLLVADYQKRQAGKQTEYFYAATYEAVLSDYIKLFDSLRIKIRVATLESFALATVLGPKDEKQTALILDIGSRNTIATIVTQQFVRESVTIANAGDVWTKTIKESQNISWEEAEKKKVTLGIVSSPDNTVAPLILPWIQRWSAEIQMLIQFWQQNHSEKIDSVILTGGSSQLPGLSDYLQTVLNLPVVIGQAPNNVSLSNVSLQQYISTLGLAMMAGDERSGDINFVEPKLKNVKFPTPKTTILSPKTTTNKAAPVVLQTKSRKPPLILIAILIIAIGVFAFVWWRSLSPTVTNQVPIIGDSAEVQTAEVSFIADTSNGTAAINTDQPILKAAINSQILNSEPIPLSRSYWQTLRDNAARSGDGAAVDTGVLYNLLLNEQVQKLWQKNIDSLTTTYSNSQQTMLSSFVAYTVTTSTPPLAAITPEIEQPFSLIANFQVMTITTSDLVTLMKDDWRNKFQTDLPANYTLKNVTISPLPDGFYTIRMSVEAR